MTRTVLVLLALTSSLSAVADEQARFAAAADYSERNGGFAVLVMQGGKVVFERYGNGHTAKTPVHLHSATKAFWSAGAAAMVQDGLLRWDELACDTLTEWKGDARKRQITVRHLLTLSSGLGHDLAQIQGTNGAAEDKYGYAVGLRANFPPGWRFSYGPGHYYAFGELMKRKLPRTEDPLQYLKRRVLGPIGVSVPRWLHDPAGNPHVPNGAYLTARTWIRYGQFLLQKGMWEGKQVVAAEHLAACLVPSKSNAGHGLAIWLNRVGGKPSAGLARTMKSGTKGGFIYPDGLPGLYAALGAGKCRMYMVPSEQMVIVRQCDTKTDRFSDPAFLRLVFGTTGE